MKWHKAGDRNPKKEGNYLGCWREAMIPRWGWSEIKIAVFFYREKDGKWLLDGKRQTPEYWCKIKYPTFSLNEEKE